MTAAVCDMAISGEELQKLLNQHCDNCVGERLLGVKAEPLTDGQGFMSKIFRVHLIWSKPTTADVEAMKRISAYRQRFVKSLTCS